MVSYIEGTEDASGHRLPYVLPFPLATPGDSSNMLRGIHAPNALWTSEDFCRFRVAGAPAVKLMWYHTEADVVQLRGLGCRYFLMRLPDSIEGTRFKGDHEWANECIALIKRFYPLGVRDYQVDNEPNLTWGMVNAPTWRWLTDRVVRLIRGSSDVPRDVRLGLAPLSWKPATWASVEGVWIPEQRKIQDQHDFFCVHSYYQKAERYNDPSFGGNVTHWHDRLLDPAKPLVVTEWASSVHELAGWTPEQVEASRLAQYPQWLSWVSTKPYVESTFLYILSGSPDWAGFWPTDKILRALR